MSGSVVIANWKMNLTKRDAITFCKKLLALDHTKQHTIILAVPSVYLGLLASIFPSLIFAGQDVSVHKEYGPHTGEISAAMLQSCQVNYSIIGHSERRIGHFDDNQTTKIKVQNCLSTEVTPIICVGEPLEVRKRGEYLPYIKKQLLESIPHGAKDGSFILAYEPIWAIGTGIVPTKEELQEVCECIMDVARPASLVYGGSVNSQNIDTLSEIKSLDGLLVGSASLDSAEFIRIVEYWIGKC